MQTAFAQDQLQNPGIAAADKILRACVHCGFCLATCPTYVLLGSELDSPRGRIYLIKDMLEADRPADARTALHIDRCLSCLACMTTCPSGVHYMHLVDLARERITETYRRPAGDRFMRALIAKVVPNRKLFRLALRAAALGRPVAGLMGKRLRAMLALAPSRLPPASASERPQVFTAAGERKYRVALLAGCAQPVLAPQINDATVRLLTRHGCEVVVAPGAECCGALAYHMGMAGPAHATAKASIDAWCREIDGGGLDAIVINTSGCGTTIKDYGFMFRTDPDYAEKAARVSALTKDVSEFLTELGLAAPRRASALAVAYHSACSMQHGQGITEAPKALLRAAGFTVRDVPEGHLCCGSAGTYNMLQPELSARLRDRKLANLARVGADVIATGNIGCMAQLAPGAEAPVVHTVELLDWATGGPEPPALTTEE
jgi:glycolate oxidase iron-sulfur subunit